MDLADGWDRDLQTPHAQDSPGAQVPNAVSAPDMITSLKSVLWYLHLRGPECKLQALWDKQGRAGDWGQGLSSVAGLQGCILVSQRSVRWGRDSEASGTGLPLKRYHRWGHPPATCSSAVNTFGKVAEAFLPLWGTSPFYLRGGRTLFFFFFLIVSGSAIWPISRTELVCSFCGTKSNNCWPYWTAQVCRFLLVFCKDSLNEAILEFWGLLEAFACQLE